MATSIEFTLFLNVSDQEPGMPQTRASLNEWLVPDIIQAVGRVLGHPGDYDAGWSRPGVPEYEVVFPDCEHPKTEPAIVPSMLRCTDCGEALLRSALSEVDARILLFAEIAVPATSPQEQNNG